MAHSDVRGRASDTASNSSHNSYHGFYDRKHLDDKMSIDEQTSFGRGRYINLIVIALRKQYNIKIVSCLHM